MNAKNIFLAILMVLSFTACSSEIEGIDNTTGNTVNTSTASTSIMVSFSADGLTTKGAASASDIEMNINEYVIAVFEKQTGDRVGFTTGTNAGNNVTIQNIDCKEGDAIVYVVANAPVAGFTNLYTQAGFEAATVENPNALVKVGKKETKLAKDQMNSLEIKLSQLTARVKVNFNVAVESNETVNFEATSYDATIANLSAIQHINAITGESANEEINDNSFTYYTYAVANPELKLNGELTVEGTDKTKGVTITIPFEKNGKALSELKNGVSYEITVDATLTVGINAAPEISYQVHSVETIGQDITFE
ncbi:MAG: hypothetical protein LUH01_04640 [Parabacteroides gordonii]|nr:hypothetical protein [Parabacteroides gordonii]